MGLPQVEEVAASLGTLVQPSDMNGMDGTNMSNWVPGNLPLVDFQMRPFLDFQKKQALMCLKMVPLKCWI